MNLREEMNQRNLNILQRAYDFMCNELNITKHERNNIDVTTVRKMEDGTSGQCISSYRVETNELVGLSITILDYGSVLGMVDTLAHELIHTKQHLRGDFNYRQIKIPFLFFFKEKVWKQFYKDQRIDTTPYYEREHEIEAFTKGPDLALRFLKTLEAHE